MDDALIDSDSFEELLYDIFDNKKDPNFVVDTYGNTSLHICCYNVVFSEHKLDYQMHIYKLLYLNANPNIANDLGLIPLAILFKRHCISDSVYSYELYCKIIKELMGLFFSFKSELSVKDKFGKNLLHLAVEFRNLEIFKYFFNKLDFKIKEKLLIDVDDDGLTPLSYANKFFKKWDEIDF